MFNLDKFIADSVTFRPSSMFEADIRANAEKLTQEIKGKKVCVIFVEHKNVAEVYTNAKFSHLGCLCYKPETLK